MSDSEQDKKRNKLGYQRISIACAHCRRRKIRCLLADKDPQGRCQNCIRLKKECIFYPIDQQSAYDSRSESSRRGVGSASSSGVSSTSPEVQAAHGHGAGRSRFPALPQATSQGFHGVPFDPGATLQGQYLPVDRSHPEPLPSNSPWLSQVSRSFELPSRPNDTSPGHAPHPQYWPYDQSPGSGDFAPFPNDATQPVRTPSTMFSANLPQSSPEQQWQLQQQHPQALRTMTYPPPSAAMASSLPQYTPSYAADMPQQRLPSASYPPFSVPLESPQMMHQMQGPPFPTPVPSSHAFSEPYDYRAPHAQQQQQQALPIQQGYPGHWYPESSGLGFSVEEATSNPSNTPPPYVVPSQRPH